MRKKKKSGSIDIFMVFYGASLVAQLVKNLLAVQETWVRSLGWADPLKERAWQPTPVFLPGEALWRVESASMGSQRVRHD